MMGYADNQQLSMQLAHRFGRQRPDFEGKESWGLYSAQAEMRMQSIFGIQAWNSIRALDFQFANKLRQDSGVELLEQLIHGDNDTVTAIDEAGNESARAVAVQVRTEGPDQVAPATPQNVSAVADEANFGQVTVRWSPSVRDADQGDLTGLQSYIVFARRAPPIRLFQSIHSMPARASTPTVAWSS